MNDFTSLLQQVADRADVTLLPQPPVLRANAGRRARRARITAAGLAAGAVAAVLAVTATVVAVRSDRPQPARNPDGSIQLPVPTGTIRESRPAGAGRSVPTGAAGARITAVAPFRDGFAALVWPDRASRDDPVRTQLWTFADGAWHPPADGRYLPGGGWDLLVPFGDGLAVVGRDGPHGPVIWHSHDLTTWSPLEVPTTMRPADFETIDGVAAVGIGWIAWGSFDKDYALGAGNYVPLLWSSSDGITWTVSDREATLASDHTQHICWVEQVAGGFVAVGTGARSPSDNPDARDPRVFSSTDRMAWHQQSAAGLPSDLCRRRMADQRMATGPAGTLLVRFNGDATYWPAAQER